VSIKYKVHVPVVTTLDIEVTINNSEGLNPGVEEIIHARLQNLGRPIETDATSDDIIVLSEPDEDTNEESAQPVMRPSEELPTTEIANDLGRLREMDGGVVGITMISNEPEQDREQAEECEQVDETGQSQELSDSQDSTPAGNIYYDAASDREIFVSDGLTRGQLWKAYWRKRGETGEHSFKSPETPQRKTRAEAQADLDAYAKKTAWVIAGDNQDNSESVSELTQEPEAQSEPISEPKAEPTIEQESTPIEDPIPEPAQAITPPATSATSDVFTGELPALSSLIEPGDLFIKIESKRLPGMDVKPIAVQSVEHDRGRIIVPGKGPVMFSSLDDSYRLYLCEDTVRMGDRLKKIQDGSVYNVMYRNKRLDGDGYEAATLDDNGTSITINWDELDNEYQMLCRGPKEQATNVSAEDEPTETLEEHTLEVDDTTPADSLSAMLSNGDAIQISPGLEPPDGLPESTVVVEINETDIITTHGPISHEVIDDLYERAPNGASIFSSDLNLPDPFSDD